MSVCAYFYTSPSNSSLEIPLKTTNAKPMVALEEKSGELLGQ